MKQTAVDEDGGSFSALDVSFENADQVLELSTPTCSMTPLLIDYGLEASGPCDINSVSNVNKLSENLRVMSPSIVLFNLLGIDKNNMLSRLRGIANELHKYVKDAGYPCYIGL